MQGNIYISGMIGSTPTDKGVDLIDIIAQVKNQPSATSFDVHINSEGGFVDVGFDIYNYLKNLNVPVKTIGTGLVASIATVIFMAGEQRELKEGTKFMIHLPWMGEVSGTADELEQYSAEVRQVEDRLVKFYSDLLTIDKDAIKALLREETWLEPAKALELGITTKTVSPVAIKAYLNKNTNTNMTKDDKNWIEGLFNSVLSKFKSVKNIVLQDTDGREIEFPTVEDGQDVAVGDTATIDGAPAEGEAILPSGLRMRFENGQVIEILQPEDESETEEEAVDYKKLYEEMQAEVNTLTEAKQNFEAKLAEKDELILNAKKDILNLKKQITSKFDVDFTKDAKKDTETKASVLDGIKKLREKRKTK